MVLIVHGVLKITKFWQGLFQLQNLQALDQTFPVYPYKMLELLDAQIVGGGESEKEKQVHGRTTPHDNLEVD